MGDDFVASCFIRRGPAAWFDLRAGTWLAGRARSPCDLGPIVIDGRARRPCSPFCGAARRPAAPARSPTRGRPICAAGRVFGGRSCIMRSPFGSRGRASLSRLKAQGGMPRSFLAPPTANTRARFVSSFSSDLGRWGSLPGPDDAPLLYASHWHARWNVGVARSFKVHGGPGLSGRAVRDFPGAPSQPWHENIANGRPGCRRFTYHLACSTLSRPSRRRSWGHLLALLGGLRHGSGDRDLGARPRMLLGHHAGAGWTLILGGQAASSSRVASARPHAVHARRAKDLGLPAERVCRA